MRHILLIDPLDKLNLKKDSSLSFALELKKLGIETYLLFSKDLFIQNLSSLKFKVYNFSGSFSDGFYLGDFKLETSIEIILKPTDIIHMRLDPPVDQRYLRTLWLLDFVEQKGLKVINRPASIAKNNEKLLALSSSYGPASYVGESIEGLDFFMNQQNNSKEFFILKPLDLYSGIGVEKLNKNKVLDRFLVLSKKYSGALVVQPFLEEIYQGEHRVMFFNNQYMGSILKTPKKGEFLSNIAQGASFKQDDPSARILKGCHEISQKLFEEGINWIAFDCLGEYITEVNITCPGLVVELSFAYQKSFSLEMAKSFLEV